MGCNRRGAVQEPVNEETDSITLVAFPCASACHGRQKKERNNMPQMSLDTWHRLALLGCSGDLVSPLDIPICILSQLNPPVLAYLLSPRSIQVMEVIADLSSKHGAPSFTPHLTLLGPVTGEEQAFAD